MNRLKLIIATSCLLFSFTIAGAQDHQFVWKRTKMDNSRTGCKPATASNIEESLGKMEGTVYVSPSGKKFKKGSTPKVAELLLKAQPEMSALKQVIAHSAAVMETEYPESALSNWFIDELMRAVEDSTREKSDIGITNFGGIRCPMPKGEVLLDDIMSMFPLQK